MDEYALFLIRKYGPNILEELNRAKYTATDMDVFKLDLIAKEYKERYKALLKQM
jgi:hypothetical protein